ncbi:MAG: hypothetical protein HYV60_15860 [Planctomycetia bacterium]|nr:hypothetical protein [Planctomycetia bacterium]
MQFCFYPQHEHGCPHVSHCPHLGGAALGTLVWNANTSGDTIAGLHRSLDAERKRNSQLVEENLQLEEALKQAKLELKLERQNKFATNQQKQAGDSAENKAAEESATHEPKKRGAPVGHPGWFRPTPTHYDWAVDVPAPSRCPHCQGHVTVCDASAPDEHLQEGDCGDTALPSLTWQGESHRPHHPRSLAPRQNAVSPSCFQVVSPSCFELFSSRSRCWESTTDFAYTVAALQVRMIP